MAVATVVNPTRYTDIMNAIFDVVENHSGLAFPAGATKYYDFPTAEELDPVGQPFLVVRAGDLQSWAVGGAEGPDMRVPSSVEPVWCWEVYVLFSYSDQSYATQNHGPAADALLKMITAFIANWNLEDTCDSMEILAGRDNTGLTYVDIGGVLWRAAQVTLVTYETLMVEY